MDLGVGRARGEVVAVEGDVDVPERDLGLEQVARPAGAGGWRGARRGGGCPRARRGGRRASPRSRARCARACGGCRPRRGRPWAASYGPSWPHGTGLKGVAQKLAAATDVGTGAVPAMRSARDVCPRILGGRTVAQSGRRGRARSTTLLGTCTTPTLAPLTADVQPRCSRAERDLASSGWMHLRGRSRRRRLALRLDERRARRAPGTGPRSRRSRAGRRCRGRSRAPRRGRRAGSSAWRGGSARAAGRRRRARARRPGRRSSGRSRARGRARRTRNVASWTSTSAPWASTSTAWHGAVSPESTIRRPGRGSPTTCSGRHAADGLAALQAPEVRALGDAEARAPRRRRSAPGGRPRRTRSRRPRPGA